MWREARALPAMDGPCLCGLRIAMGYECAVMKNVPTCKWHRIVAACSGIKIAKGIALNSGVQLTKQECLHGSNRQAMPSGFEQENEGCRLPQQAISEPNSRRLAFAATVSMRAVACVLADAAMHNNTC